LTRFFRALWALRVGPWITLASYQALEDEFNSEWKNVTNESGKLAFRKSVTLNHGIALSGKLPPSRVAHYLSEFDGQ